MRLRLSLSSCRSGGLDLSAWHGAARQYPLDQSDAALAFCQRLVDWPRASLITPGRRHWELFTGLCRDIKGPLVADAYLAALAIEHGCELVSTDSGFARFPGLRCRHPLAAT